MVEKTFCPIMSTHDSVVYCKKNNCELFNEPTQMCCFSRLHQIGEALEAIENGSKREN